MNMRWRLCVLLRLQRCVWTPLAGASRLTCWWQGVSVAAVVIVRYGLWFGFVALECACGLSAWLAALDTRSTAGGVDEPAAGWGGEGGEQSQLMTELLQVLVNAVCQAAASLATTLLAPQRGFLWIQHLGGQERVTQVKNRVPKWLESFRNGDR